MDISSLLAFIQGYPAASAYLFYGGSDCRHLQGIELTPLGQDLTGAQPGLFSGFRQGISLEFFSPFPGPFQNILFKGCFLAQKFGFFCLAKLFGFLD